MSMVSAQVSLYPLRQVSIGPAIREIGMVLVGSDGFQVTG